MAWERLAAYAWEGAAAAVITMGTSLVVVQAWPSRVQWLTLIAGGLVAGIKAIQAYRTEPK